MEEKRTAALMDHFGGLADPRIDRHKEHRLMLDSRVVDVRMV